MAVSLILALLVAQADDGSDNAYRATRDMRVRRAGARSGPGYAFFEAFPVGGAGTTSACSTTPPTGAKGEALTFARGSVATCTATAAGGLVSSGIANGDLVELSSNVARVEYDSAGVKGLRVEGSGQNVLPRFIDYTNGAWSDVGTPTPTTGQASPFSGTYANSAVLYDDNDGAGFEGRSIPVTVSAGSAYIAHCYVKAGTATSARIVLDGTAATITGLSSSTWSIVEVADASASAASVTFEVDVGSTAATTGSVVFGGCDVKLGTYRTSIVPTVAAAVTRSAETAYVSLSSPSASQSIAATRNGPTGGSGARVLVLTQTNGAAAYGIGIYSNSGTGTALLGNTPNTLTAGTLATTTRAWASWDGATFSVNFDGTGNTSSPGASITVRNSLSVGLDTAGGSSGWADGIISRICLDPSPTRCR